MEKIHDTFCAQHIFFENCAVFKIMSKNCGAREAADDSMAARCLLDK